MDRDLDHLQQLADQRSSFGTALVYGIALLYLLHQVLAYFDFPVLSPQELVWNAVVYILPKQLLLDRARRQELKANGMLSQTHAAKSEALRRMLGIGGHTLLQKLPGEGIMRRASGFSRQPTTDAPPGLGNWDNSCYQNSVLQGLASLDSLKPYLRHYSAGVASRDGSTTETLLETINRLNDPSNNGKQLWTPAKLKNMSSWQQQDAQEYFSKIMDELDKEAAKSIPASKPKPGLESIAENASESQVSKERAAEPIDQDIANVGLRNPMDGLLAQRVACTRCGFSEGLSMIPFNCLTVPLGSDFAYDLEECLDEYTKLEEISEVECSKCTLLRVEQQLTQMLPAPPGFQSTDSPAPTVDSKVLQLPPELRAQAFKRLRAIQQALEDDDFEDTTLNEACQIPKKARVSSTKTRQAVIGRTPQNLLVHVNRSVFDEMTGVQRKNYASVRYPLLLNLMSWMLSGDVIGEEVGGDQAMDSVLSEPAATKDGVADAKYRLKAVVTHYGRHENGHYICYRQHPLLPKVESELDGLDDDIETEDPDVSKEKNESQWWRLSDEDVSPVSEPDVLGQGGVFMLFYERESVPEMPAPIRGSIRAITETPLQEVTETIRSQDDDLEEAAAIPLPLTSDLDLETQPEELHTSSSSTDEASTSPLSEASHAPSSTGATTEDESEVDGEDQVPPQDSQSVPTSPSPPLMRTARGRQSSRSETGFGGNAFRAVAAT